MYLAEIGAPLAATLFRLVGQEANQVADVGRSAAQPDRVNVTPEPTLEEWERRIESNIQADQRLDETERRALVLARRGQGLFRASVQFIERACRVTKVERREHLIASHIKPWRDSANDERLSGENGLLLTPTIDHLFDKGFISFEGDGDLIVSPVADPASLRRMGILDHPVRRSQHPYDVARLAGEPLGVSLYINHRDHPAELQFRYQLGRLQPVLTARTSGKRCTSATKLASKGDLLSFLQARASSSGTFKSTTDVMTTLLGHRQRAVPRTHPTPNPVATRLRIIASFSPS